MNDSFPPGPGRGEPGERLREARLDRAVRSALEDMIAAAPASPAPSRGRALPTRRRAVGPWSIAAASLAAAAGAIGIVAVRTDRSEPADEIAGEQPVVQEATAQQPAAVPPAPGLQNQGASPCGRATIPAGATGVQTISGDIDGDAVDDTVTLYQSDGAWHVNATSSVKGWASDTAVTIDVHDAMAVSFEDVDYSLGAAVPPALPIMATGTGTNSDGILANFTFLSNTPQYCVKQWTYTPPGRPTEPFQWVALQEPGHVTGMVCEGAAGSRYYSLVDSEQHDDGSWHVITRLLEHDFTKAEITFQPEQTLPDSPDFASRYGDIVGCDHPAVGSAAPSTSAATTVAPAAPTSAAAAGPCGNGSIPAGATVAQTISGDIDGDTVADTVTLYRNGGAWHVNATSSVKGWASDTTVSLDVHDSLSLSFEDVDYSLGAEVPPPKAVMVTGTGTNSKGILADFTFLTNTQHYCIAQWTYQGAPFQWVALQAPGHVTGMICDGAMGSRYSTLVDSTQNADGSWRVITRVLTHDFTTAQITMQPDQTVPDSADFASQYGNIVNCDHPPV